MRLIGENSLFNNSQLHYQYLTTTIFFSALCTHEVLQSKVCSRNKIPCEVRCDFSTIFRDDEPYFLLDIIYLSELFCLIAQCKQGTYSPNGLETCETCPLGTYQPSFGSRNCISCPENTSTVKRGAVDVSACGGL